MDAGTATLQAAVPTTDPTGLFDMVEGMHAVNALTASVACLNLYDWLEQNPGASEAKICESLDLAPRPTHVLLTLLVSIGLIAGGPMSGYVLTPLAREMMLPDSPWSLAPCFSALKDSPPCQAMLTVLKTGKTLGAPAEDDVDQADWAARMNDEGFAEYFLNAIDSRNAYLAHVVAERADLSGRARLLDVGGGSGIYACALVKQNPGLRATVLEKAPVDAVARRAIARRGVADRVTVSSGDMFGGPLPDGHDVHLYSNVIHDWDEATIRQLLRASFEALPPDGQIMVHDAFLDENEAGPKAVAEYSVLLMAFTSGRCYGLGELRELLVEVGFADVVCRPTAVHRSLVTASKRRSSNGNGSGRRKS